MTIIHRGFVALQLRHNISGRSADALADTSTGGRSSELCLPSSGDARDGYIPTPGRSNLAYLEGLSTGRYSS